MQITLPLKSGIFLLEDPAFGRLVGTPPEDGTSDDRSNAIRFEEGEAVFSIGHYQRGLVAVSLISPFMLIPRALLIHSHIATRRHLE